MNSTWQEFLGASGARINLDSAPGLVADFGDLPGELAAARDTTVVAPLTHLGTIECTGDDATSFLHNQLTSDVNHLATGAAQYSSWCTAKGRMQASFVLYRADGALRALLSADLVAATLKRLQVYVFRSKVKLADLSPACETIGLSGAQAEAALQNAGLPIPASPFETAPFTDGSVIRLDAKRFLISVASAAAPQIWKRLAETARPVGTPVWQWLDVDAGIPLVTEATKEAFVPQMANFDQIGGVSFKKGCYPGQEVISRAKYLGKIKRHLYRIHGEQPMKAGDSLWSPENQETACGLIANAAPSPDGGFDALGVIHESFASTAALHLGALDGPVLKVALIEVEDPA